MEAKRNSNRRKARKFTKEEIGFIKGSAGFLSLNDISRRLSIPPSTFHDMLARNPDIYDQYKARRVDGKIRAITELKSLATKGSFKALEKLLTHIYGVNESEFERAESDIDKADQFLARASKKKSKAQQSRIYELKQRASATD